MKIIIDQKNKKIICEKSITVNDFFDYMNRLLPKEEQKGYTFEVREITSKEWRAPIVIYPNLPAGKSRQILLQPYITKTMLDKKILNFEL